MKVFVSPSNYTPDPTGCNDKWCSRGDSNFPASGNFPITSECSDYKTLVRQQLATGGISGRGVTPCPFGMLNSVPMGANGDVNVLTHLDFKNINEVVGNAIFFDPYRPGWLPPTGGIRPLTRVGNEWKN